MNLVFVNIFRVNRNEIPIALCVFFWMQIAWGKQRALPITLDTSVAIELEWLGSPKETVRVLRRTSASYRYVC